MSQQGHKPRPDESGTVQPLEARDLTLADALGKYRLLGALGHGGMADVYLAVADGPEGFRKLCVLKLLKETMAQDEEYRAMFLDEARLAARLNHPNIVQTFEVGETHGRLMIAMEYVEGQTVMRVRRRLAPELFPLTSGIRVLCDVCEALDYAHALVDFDGSRLHVVHRDVSPQNIVIGYDARVKLVDFGIAKSSAAMQETQAGVLKGKVGYMAPEQASMRPIDGRADVFSVGVILWEMIAGRRLAEGVSAQEVLVRRIAGNDPKIIDVVPEVDPKLAAICDRAMASQPEDRYVSAGELQADLEGWLKQHREPTKKELSRALREAFHGEREQLRSLVEQRMADSAMSGMRQALLGGGLPSLGRLHATGEAPSITPARYSAPPGSGPQLPTGPQATLPMIDVNPASSSAERASLTAPTVALESRPRGTPAAAVIAIVTVVALGIAAAIWIAKSSMSTPAAPSRTAATAPPPAPSDSGKTGPVLTPADLASSTAAPTVATPSSGKPTTKPPVFFPIGKGTPPVAHAPSATATAAPPTPATTPGTGPTAPAGGGKQPSRPLDEKDPYAP